MVAAQVGQTLGFSKALHSSQAPLTLTSVKSRMGFATECAGIAALHRLLLSAVWGVISPNNHLQQLNPHLEFENKAGMLTASWLNVNASMLHLFSGEHDASQGAAGNSAAQHIYGCVGSWFRWHAGPRNFLWPRSTNQDLVRTSVSCPRGFSSDPLSVRTAPQPERNRNVFNFWPGGGGELEEEALQMMVQGSVRHGPTPCAALARWVAHLSGATTIARLFHCRDLDKVEGHQNGE